MKSGIVIMIICCLCSLMVKAQQPRFPSSGTIEFQKTINMQAVINKQLKEGEDGFMKQVYEQYKSNFPQFKHLKATLKFADNKTLYTPLPDSLPETFITGTPQVSQVNTVYTDPLAGTYVCQKRVFGDNFLISDSIRDIKWKITSETREIAGYQCRRANAIIMDSVYVVAFYTDQIHISGGPESFAGLPGMILGVALPHDNLTWFATKITLTTVPAASVVPPKRGKVYNRVGFEKAYHDAFKNNNYNYSLWFML